MNVFSCTRVVRAQYYVKFEYHWRQAHSSVVVVGKLGVHLHLRHAIRAAHDHVLISVNRHRAQVEIHRAKITTKHAGQYAEKVSRHDARKRFDGPTRSSCSTCLTRSRFPRATRVLIEFTNLRYIYI